MQDSLKKQAAAAALEYISDTKIIGIGTGSTVNHFIDLLAPISQQFEAAVSSSKASTKRLCALGIPVIDLNEVESLDVYVDGADEINPSLHLIKGGGGALTREKIIAAASRSFICIADESKLVKQLGEFPLPIEVIPMSSNYVARQISRLGGRAILREGFITDNGNHILDVHDLHIDQAPQLENSLNNLVGMVTVGLFAERGADIVLLASEQGVKTISA
ncbi:MAG: ribose 5-phosphate isomerase A [Cycloclasticus sp. symbiont of Poecilosclerida sp. M]|nr:MAG: ribose 5-phosphate isomerase A [Cycloclasticus sp. symbiont of Poecilosclerida sp. M]